MTTFDRLQTIIAETLGVDLADIKPASSFVEDLGADSLDLVEMVIAIEDEFKISIPDDDVEQLKTVQNAVDYLEDKIQ